MRAQWQLVWTASNSEFGAASQRNHAFASAFIRILFIRVLCRGTATRAFYWVRPRPRVLRNNSRKNSHALLFTCASLDPLFLQCAAHISTDIQGLSMDLANDWMHSVWRRISVSCISHDHRICVPCTPYYVGPFMRIFHETWSERVRTFLIFHGMTQENGGKRYPKRTQLNMYIAMIWKYFIIIVFVEWVWV